MMRLIFVLALIAALAACGGGDPVPEEAPSAERASQVSLAPPRASSIAPATIAAPATYTASTIKVVLYGDSTEDGLKHAGTNNAIILQNRYDKFGRDIRIWEEAVGGTAALQLLTGADGEHQETFDRSVAATNAQIVGFRYGLNDHRFYDAETFRTVLTALTRMAEGAGKIVILQTPSPVDLTPEQEENIKANVRVIREVAAAHSNTVLCDHSRVGNRIGYETVDGVHPTLFDYRRRQSITLTKCVDAAIAKLPV